MQQLWLVQQVLRPAELHSSSRYRSCMTSGAAECGCTAVRTVCQEEEAGTQHRSAEFATVHCCILRNLIFQCLTSTNHKILSSMRSCWEERTVLVTPLRLRPARVRRRGSSHPPTNPSVTSLFSLRLDSTLYVRLRRAYSQTTGLY